MDCRWILRREHCQVVNLGELLKPFVFFDYAYGRQKPLINSEGDTSASLMDAGIGLKFSQGKSFSGNLVVGFPLREKFEQINVAPVVDDYRLVFDFQYSF